MPVPKDSVHHSWHPLLATEFQSTYFQNLEKFIEDEYNYYTIFPAKSKIFEALNISDYDNLKVIILGQDPYHKIGQAHGLSFSVLGDQKLPPSLRNIFKELKQDLKIDLPQFGNLSSWARSGVLLLNSVLTVREKQPASHKNQGWELFTDSIIQKISHSKNHVVFILWGSFAQGKKGLIDSSKHLIIESSHPSPLSAYRGFFGSKPFSKTNVYLKSKGIAPVNWELK